MSVLRDLVGSVSLPPLFAVVRHLRDDRLDDPGGEVLRAMNGSGLEADLPAGGEVAIAVGSRGISVLPEMVRAVAGWFSACSCRPFVIPAMGSHGGYRRDHLRALAQRVEVSEREVRIMGSKNTLLGVLGGFKWRGIGGERCSHLCSRVAERGSAYIL